MLIVVIMKNWQWEKHRNQIIVQLTGGLTVFLGQIITHTQRDNVNSTTRADMLSETIPQSDNLTKEAAFKRFKLVRIHIENLTRTQETKTNQQGGGEETKTI